MKKSSRIWSLSILIERKGRTGKVKPSDVGHLAGRENSPL